jgi:hypothetical protein
LHALGGGEEDKMRGWLRYLCRRKMCYQTFLHNVEALREAGFALSLDPSGAIRFFASTGEEHCPITAVCAMTTGKTYDLRQYQEAGRALGMRSRTIKRIADSADSSSKAYTYFSEAVRRALLAGSLAGFSQPPQDEPGLVLEDEPPTGA